MISSESQFEVLKKKYVGYGIGPLGPLSFSFVADNITDFEFLTDFYKNYGILGRQFIYEFNNGPYSPTEAKDYYKHITQKKGDPSVFKIFQGSDIGLLQYCPQTMITEQEIPQVLQDIQEFNSVRVLDLSGSQISIISGSRESSLVLDQIIDIAGIVEKYIVLTGSKVLGDYFFRKVYNRSHELYKKFIWVPEAANTVEYTATLDVLDSSFDCCFKRKDILRWHREFYLSFRRRYFDSGSNGSDGTDEPKKIKRSLSTLK